MSSLSICVLELAAPMKRLGEISALLVEIDASEHRLGACLEGGKVFRDPVRRHLAVSVSGEDHAVALIRFPKPSLGEIHSRATRGAGVRGRRRQSSFDDADVERQSCAELSGEARTPIGTIVGEHDNPDEARRNWLPGAGALPGESAQTGRQARFFILDGYGDNETWSNGRDEPGKRCGEQSCPGAGWVV